MNTRRLVCLLVLLGALVRAHAQPVITRQPVDRSVSLGASVQFQVSATSTHPPIFYQWRFGTTDLPGQTNSSLNVSNVQLTSAGDYDAVLKDNSGSVASRLVQLQVDPTFTKITTGSIVTELGSYLAPAWGDYDNDGFIDLAVPSTVNTVNNTAQKIKLFHNNRDGTFTEVVNSVISAEARDWRGCSWADYNNDGYLDLFAASAEGLNGIYFFQSENELFRNNGDGTFTKMKATEVGPIVSNGGTASEGPVWGDYDRDGFLDLFLARAGTDWLFHNQGDGTFAKVTNTAVGLLQDNLQSYGAMWGDYDNDGWPDLFVAAISENGVNDQTNLVYHNRGDGTFARILTGSIVTDNEPSLLGMWVDYDNDGYLDLFVSNLSAGAINSLYHNNGNGTFTRMASNIVGSIVSDKGFHAGATWGDYDNDGFLDLFVANFDPAGGPNFLYHNNGDGSFTRVLTGSVANDADAPSDNAAWGDYDNDGFLDLFVSRGGVTGPATCLLYRNNGNNNGWIKIKCIGTVSNRSAIGAKVRVKATIRGKTMWQMREINSGGGFGQSPLDAHFGLGDATNIETLRIEWPSGTVQESHNVAAKQNLTITEPSRLFVQMQGGFPALFLKGGRNLHYEIGISSDISSWHLAYSLMITNMQGIAPVRWCEVCDTNTMPSFPGAWFVRARLVENP